MKYIQQRQIEMLEDVSLMILKCISDVSNELYLFEANYREIFFLKRLIDIHLKKRKKAFFIFFSKMNKIQKNFKTF
jgi:hypothetical protein